MSPATRSRRWCRSLDWIQSGTLTVDWALRVDALTAVMLVVVTTVSSLVHLYSWGYMEEDPGQPRFFAYLSLFSFAMLMLVTADNLVQMFFGWEGVGLASYLLIGFWYHKPSANAAALKAFVVNRVGDFGFILGIFGTFLVFGTVSIPAILAAAPGMAGSTIGFAGMRVDTMTLLCLLLFVGAMGKSAQLGLHTWLPDAMEGPTPVSALIHAATMVTAGVFMVCRLSPMFETSPTAMHVVTYVGAATCFFAATVGSAQNDIKRVIAYSTCSQLGYMFFAAGVGAYGAAMFHLFTHAFFKALLFLGAGSVIHAMHHEQDMRYYGALRKEIPITFWVMVIGTLAITGVGVVGRRLRRLLVEGRDPRERLGERLGLRHDRLLARRARRAADQLLFLAADVPDLLRASRAGPRRSISSTRSTATMIRPTRSMATARTTRIAVATGTGGYHPHESPLTMLVPIGLLALGAVARRAALPRHLRRRRARRRNSGAAASRSASTSPMRRTRCRCGSSCTPTIVMLVGLCDRLEQLHPRPERAGSFVAQFPAVYRFVANKWYFDELYDRIFVRPAMWLGRLFWKGGDEGTIDRFGPHGAAYAVGVGNRITARLQSGYLYSYALVMLLGLIGAASWAIWWATSDGAAVADHPHRRPADRGRCCACS